ncbi:hypothetical protein K470DRAFT_103500 [Piedraia hortae CBS 480.64]|uniref:Uncharacterized protein n=1 Tax=Piedraia hortae CBS 480.64 TaxID=1314780 RepID=A0A6A7C8E6_9PEZI|nr:hypothetical protein K470DRAFT_103500 [Piedraia hortae CBS 480.64]
MCVTCLRKLHGGEIEDILADFISFAAPKQRLGDMNLIHQFDPSLIETVLTRLFFTHALLRTNQFDVVWNFMIKCRRERRQWMTVVIKERAT